MVAAFGTALVIGAGLGGLSLSLGLANAGFHVELIEKKNGFDASGATFALQKNGMKALQELEPGILQDLEGKGIPTPPTGGLMFGWWMVRDALLEKVQNNRKITLRTGMSIQEIDDCDDCITAKFIKSDDGNHNTDKTDIILSLKADFLVGSDGVNSAVRSLLDLPPAKRTETVSWKSKITVDLESEDNTRPPHSILRPLLDKSIVPIGFVSKPGVLNYALFNFHAKSPGVMGLSLNVQKDSANIPRNADAQPFLEAHAEDEEELELIRAICSAAETESLQRPIPLKVVELPDEDGKGWGGKGRVTLIGDSAHAMRPASGQGGSMAFEDSVMLCRALIKDKGTMLRNKSDTEDLLRSFENSRIDRVRQIWIDQWERAEASYKDKAMGPWSEEFEKWVYDGV